MTRYHLILLIGAVVYFSNLGGTSVYILDEAKNAGCAMEMKQTQNWIVPTFNGKLRTDKPPLHYYFMMTAYSVFGVNPFAARFFSAIAGILVLVLVYRNIRIIINEQTAFYSSLVMLSSIQLTIQFHLAVPDPYLILCVVVSLFSFYRGIHSDNRQMKWLYVACALGFLAKGLIAIVMPGLIICTYLMMTRKLNLQTIKELNLPLGITLFTLIALPWYAAVGYLTDGDWLRGFFIQHNLDRYTSTMEGHRGFPLAPFVILIVALLPFSVFITQALSTAWKERVQQPFLLLCLITSFAFAAFFSFSKTILPSYPAPAIPFLSVLLGFYLFCAEKEHASVSVPNRISLAVGCIISLAVCAAAFVALQRESEMNLSNLFWIFLVLPIGSGLGIFFFIYRKWSLFIYSWAGSWIVLVLLFFYVAYPEIDAKNPVSKSIPTIRRDYPDHKIVGYQVFNPAYVFGLKEKIEVINSVEELKAMSSKGEKIIVVTRDRYKEDFQHIETLKEVYSGKDLFERNRTVVLAN